MEGVKKLAGDLKEVEDCCKKYKYLGP